MKSMKDRNRERRCKRKLEKEGYVLRKNHGMYWIVNASYNCIVRGGDFGITLDDVEECINETED